MRADKEDGIGGAHPGVQVVEVAIVGAFKPFEAPAAHAAGL
jgi:hypothetical protein